MTPVAETIRYAVTYWLRAIGELEDEKETES